MGGQVIKTTAEHPFYVAGKGWVEARELKVGDNLCSHNGQSVVVEELYDTGEYETVYNLRVAEFHTYFVGGEEWDFSIWSHNACVYQAVDPDTGTVRYVGVANTGINNTLNERLAAAKTKTGFEARVIPGTMDIDKEKAYAIEQALIKRFGREGIDPGGTLMQIRRGTWVSEARTKLGEKLLKKIGYPGF